MTETNLERISREVRAQLPLLDSRVALNHAGVAPQPASEAVAEFEKMRRDALPGEALASVRTAGRELRETYAKLLGVESSEIAITHHTAEGVNIVAQGFPWEAGDRIVTVSVEYPSNVYPWWNLRERGVETVVVPEREGRVDLAELEAAIDERVRLVAISHVQFASGFTVDLDRVAGICERSGTFLFVDVAQSIGVLPLNLRRIDAAAWPTWKWLMGPLGMGGLYIRKERLESLRPVFVGVDGMLPTTDYLDYRFEFRPDASRFEYSSENTLGLLASREAVRRAVALLPAISSSELAARVQSLGDRLAMALEARGYSLYSPRGDGERSGIFSFRTPGNPLEVLSRLRAGKVEAAVRAGRLRFSPHFYNSPEDIDRALACI